MTVPEPSGRFDADAFASRWRDAEPTLRRRVARFGFVDQDAVDDLVSEVKVRMIESRTDRPTRAEFVAVAEAIAWRLAVDARRQQVLDDALTVTGAWLALSDEGAIELGSDDDVDRLEWALALEAALNRLLREGDLRPSSITSVRRGVALMVRGGPYDAAERQQMHRARARLRDYFRSDGIAAAVLHGGRRLRRARSRWLRVRRKLLRWPSPAAAAVAGAVTAGVLAGYAPSGAVPGVAGGWRDAHARPGPAEAAASGSAADSTARLARLPDAVSRPPATAAAPRVRAATVTASVAARLPSSTQPGDVELVIAHGGVVGNGAAAAGLHVWCSTGVRRAACDAAAPVAASTGSLPGT
jgi:hypothetical protein